MTSVHDEASMNITGNRRPWVLPFVGTTRSK